MSRLLLAVLLAGVSGFAPRSLSTRSFVGSRPARASSSSRAATTMLFGRKKSEPVRVVVVGNGMVGQRFMEDVVASEAYAEGGIQLVSFCEEPRAAYDRVRLTKFFEDPADPSKLSLSGAFDNAGRTAWYDEHGVELHVGVRATAIDPAKRVVTATKLARPGVLASVGAAAGADGATDGAAEEVPYDFAVLATGSSAFVPPIDGKDRPGVFVYRSMEDLNAMLAYQKAHGVTSAAVIGGGLLGLEAAKAVADMGCESHIVEFADTLMCRQIDAGGHGALVGKIEDLGLKVHCGARTSKFAGEGEDGPVTALEFSNEGWDPLEVGMVVVSAGIRPRDELARDGGIAVGERGGIVVDDLLRTSDERVFAIGECALHENFIYGLVAPGYTMAKAAAKNVVAACAAETGKFFATADDAAEAEAAGTFTGADMSTKLKLLGVDVASFGVNQPRPDDEDVTELVWDDRLDGVYRKLILNKAGTLLRGGILVGDADDYAELHGLATRAVEIDPATARALLAPVSARGADAGAGAGAGPTAGMTAETNVCSCNDVSYGTLVGAVAELGAGCTLPKLKSCTKAGTGCGGCDPLVKAVLGEELKKLGAELSNNVCEHFDHTRRELMAIVKAKEYATFDEVIANHGHGDGCEVCKPAVASMLASLRNEMVLDDGRDALQDTNDRSLGNMQRGGSYSVIPRVPGGDITPEKLIQMGEVAKKHNLYTKITGAQRVDLLGAARADLPEIWADLNAAGFESGHAYGKALRTVKSCVGSQWCRYGVQDSLGFAVEVENRYKGLRAPHKLKSAVSGCVRECAEAMCKDFGLIATEQGYNVYVCGNGGAQPKHGELLGTDLDEKTVFQYLDRFLMYYVLTADKLERTARWLENLPGGIEELKAVVIDDKLGINAELEARVQHIVDTYEDEWAAVASSDKRSRKFRQFVNTDERQPREQEIEFEEIRGQWGPVAWPDDAAPGSQSNWRPETTPADVFARSEKSWVRVGDADDFGVDIGSSVLVGESQLAVFRTKRGEWYATQNMCPHKRAFVLSQGLLGDKAGTPKVACPLHKKQFALADGRELVAPDAAGEPLAIITFPVRVDDASGDVLLELPPTAELDAVLGTSHTRVTKTSCADAPKSGDELARDAISATLSGEAAVRTFNNAVGAFESNSTAASELS